ncbi:hypothetical protein FH610_040140 [Microbispora catharanthi]|uniref:Uncharacterized protein n=1 Tax=Microbispora catharanthi TaxID=1712871 RepID=A0A5N6B3Z3_9ACTN|nr:hypothetical protein FH610_040140 [Microbispora catharanthi]
MDDVAVGVAVGGAVGVGVGGVDDVAVGVAVGGADGVGVGGMDGVAVGVAVGEVVTTSGTLVAISLLSEVTLTKYSEESSHVRTTGPGVSSLAVTKKASRMPPSDLLEPDCRGSAEVTPVGVLTSQVAVWLPGDGATILVLTLAWIT